MNSLENLPDFHRDMLNQFTKEIENKKEDILKKVLKEKGYFHLWTEEKARFPKIGCFLEDGWTAFYADDSTPQGVFIIAFRDLKTDWDNSDLSKNIATVTIEWTDKLPLIPKF